ncbi:hypothetical protein LTR78_008370 [Recurvomyces mirabilis]|uniref:COP9 signalosome complex subunit 3 N-terminal helical repeats domain-containing protein n=1 Tax=Recurvomyces mirabilis TaxID=574656 RepID=A0AAE0TQA9_9PEZI|nr:hypothetical protein LTR78_008370 [Recurvomyces mirabilis]KAK5158503.1 hypothetical protein LTS14_003523 [Recurvomyces mirabilis]
MADAVSTLLSFPPDDTSSLSTKKYDDLANKFLKSLEKQPNATWTRQIEKKNILELLDPATNTIPYLYALNAQVNLAPKASTTLDSHLPLAATFLTTFDPIQARYVGEEFRVLIAWVLECVPAAGVDYLTAATTGLLRLDPTAGTFTSMHLLILRTCLDQAVPSHALPILNKDIYAFPSEPTKNVPEDYPGEDTDLSNTFITTKSGFSHKLKPEYILEYYLLGARIYLGQRNYPRARLFLEYIILTPSSQHAASAMQSEAYAQWILVGLLDQGKRYPLPRTHDGAVMKSIRSVARPYEALADCFEQRDWRKLQAEMEAGMQTWHNDGNLRAVREVREALLRFRVQDLQKRYAALSIERVGLYLGFSSEQTLQMVGEMIRQKQLHASITPSPNDTAANAVLRFHFDITPAVQDDELEQQTKRIESLITSVRDADRRLQLTKEYVEFQKRQKRAGPDAADLADQMDLSYEAPMVAGRGMDGEGDFMEELEDGDEDIMAG